MGLIKKCRENFTVADLLVGNLNTKEILTLHINDNVSFNPSAVNLPHLSHPFTLLGHFNPRTVNCNHKIITLILQFREN